MWPFKLFLAGLIVITIACIVRGFYEIPFGDPQLAVAALGLAVIFLYLCVLVADFLKGEE